MKGLINRSPTLTLVGSPSPLDKSYITVKTEWLPQLQSSEDQNIVPEPHCCL